MANVLKRDKQLAVLKCLAEGNSIRSTERLTGVHRDTVMRLLVRFGNATGRFLDVSLHSLGVRHAELDEIWTFVGKKEKRCNSREKKSGKLGDMYLFTALCQDSKLLFSHKVGRRTSKTTDEFVQDVEKRMVRAPQPNGDSPQISTDGWGPYQPAIRMAFGESVGHGVIVKGYEDPNVGRYAPPTLVGSERTNVRGIRNLWSICTSHVERLNLSIRTFMRRFTRLAIGFSKKLENLVAATNLHVGVYNFVRRHRSLDNTTPAMAAGVVPTLWSWDDFYDAVQDHERQWKRRTKVQRLIDRMNAVTG